MTKKDIIDLMSHFKEEDDIKLVIVKDGKEVQFNIDFLVMNTHKIHLKEVIK